MPDNPKARTISQLTQRIEKKQRNTNKLGSHFTGCRLHW